MVRLFREDDATLEPLVGKTIAVLGYGNQGRAQSLNMRDSGMTIIVGNADDKYAADAREDGFEIHSIRDAAARGDIILSLLPDEVTPAIYAESIRPGLKAGDTLVFASGYCICFDQISFPDDINVVMVAPRTMGALVRESYLNGRGFLSFLDAHQDVDGQAWPIALALAKAIGSLKYYAMQATFKSEAELDLFTEQALVPAIAAALMTAVEVLVAAGYDKIESALEMYLSGEMGDILHEAAHLGFVGQTSLHSPTSRYGTKSRLHLFATPEFRKNMEEILVNVQNRSFANEWAAEQAGDYQHFRALEKSMADSVFAQVEWDVMHELAAATPQ